MADDRCVMWEADVLRIMYTRGFVVSVDRCVGAGVLGNEGSGDIYLHRARSMDSLVNVNTRISMIGRLSPSGLGS